MLKSNTNYNSIKKQLLALGRKSFGLKSLIRAGLYHDKAVNLLKIIATDHDFFNISSKSDFDSWRFISTKAIIALFVEINLRPSGTFNELIAHSQMHNFIRMKLDLNKKSFSFNGIINFLSDFGLVKLVDSKYSFPTHHLLKYIPKRLTYSKEFVTITDYIAINSKKGDFDNFYNYIYEGLRSVLNTLKVQEEKTFLQRYGLINEDRLTLEDIGSQMGVTRERIRQIEQKTFRKLRHPTRLSKIKNLYYQILIINKGCILIPRSILNIHINTIVLIFVILSVPYRDINEGLIIGGENIITSCFDKKMFLHKEVNLQMIREQLGRIGYWWLGDEDSKRILEGVQKIIAKRQLKYHRVYITLKTLGKPSHFSEIAIKHNEIFPEYYGSKHNIHASLCYYQEHFVWTGKLGIYALPEWGYERPQMGLHKTCYKIVNEQYKKTKKPVEYSFVLSQIHKYRKLLNPNSVMFSCYLNRDIDIVNDKKLIPAAKVKTEFIETDEDYKQIEKNLKGFEKRLKNSQFILNCKNRD